MSPNLCSNKSSEAKLRQAAHTKQRKIEFAITLVSFNLAAHVGHREVSGLQPWCTIHTFSPSSRPENLPIVAAICGPCGAYDKLRVGSNVARSLCYPDTANKSFYSTRVLQGEQQGPGLETEWALPFHSLSFPFIPSPSLSFPLLPSRCHKTAMPFCALHITGAVIVSRPTQ